MRPEIIVAFGLCQARGNFSTVEEVAHDPIRHGPVIAIHAVMVWAQPNIPGELKSARSTQAHAPWG
jgi:hypothetical protein